MDMESRSYDDSAAHVVTLPQFNRPRHVPDVPEDVDFLMDHLNDPNYDIRHGPHSPSASSDSLAMDKKKASSLSGDFSVKESELDTESQIESTRYTATSRMSDFTDFDEYVQSISFLGTRTNKLLASHLTQKFAPLWPVSMTQQCQSTHFACGFWVSFTRSSSPASTSSSPCDVSCSLRF